MKTSLDQMPSRRGFGRFFAMLFVAAAVAAIGVAAPPGAPAGDSAVQKDAKLGRVTLEMPVVKATTEHSNVDPRLEDIARQLSNLRFTGYELLTTEKAQLAPKGSETFTVVGQRKVRLELLQRDQQRARVRVQIKGAKGKSLLDTTVWVNRNGTFIVAGPKLRDGILVLPLTARY